MKWLHNRYLWVVVILAVTAGAVVLAGTSGPEAKPVSLEEQIATRLRTTLEQQDPEQHNHAGHAALQADAGPVPVVCGVRVYGHEPAGATELADVRTVYGYHFCGLAEQKRPWDIAVKLAGPVIVDMAVEPPGIQVVEATENVRFVDRLRQMFPPEYADVAQKEALADDELADLRRRYDAAAGV